MHALVVYCHPNPDSYTAAVKATVLSRLQAAGISHEVIDLYAEHFSPTLTPAELACYETVGENCAGVPSHVAALSRADTLIFVYPTWWYGLPAMLKGWLDRVLLPGIAFHMPKHAGETITRGLQHITRLGVFTTCGASWGLTRLIGAPGRRTLLRGVGLLCHRRVRTAFAAHYLMDSSTPESRAKHLKKVAREMDRLIARRAPSGTPKTAEAPA